MRERTLVTKRRYFGFDALEFRAASTRVLARLVGLPPERLCISARHLRHDFAVDTTCGSALLDGLVADGLLEPQFGERDDYRLTERFFEFATARVVEPLTRQRAKEVLARACQLATRVNAEWTRNSLEIEVLAPFGSYMSRDATLAELPLGIVVRSRPAWRRARWGPIGSHVDGAREIRAAFRGLSSFVRVRLVRELRLLPRPFAVAFEER